LIRFAAGTEEDWLGYLYILLLMVINLCKTVLTSQFQFTQQLVGLRIKTALTSAIYRKSLKLSSSARKHRTGQET
jgi:ATP-binding cassette subfamily C (CFTR/MRP) protein 1